MNKRVHYNHRLLGHTSVWVNLLQHLVDVGGVGRVVRLPLVLVGFGHASFLGGALHLLRGGLLWCSLGYLLSFLCCALLGHCYVLQVSRMIAYAKLKWLLYRA
jgi:hypothetical protein